MNKINRVFLFVSDASTLLGVSKYNPQNCFERLFKKYDYQTIETIKVESVKTIETTVKQKETLNVKKEYLKQKLEDKKITKRQFDMENYKIEQENDKLEQKITDTQECIDLLTLNKKQYVEKKIGKENIEMINAAKDISEKTEKTKAVKDKLVADANLSKETIDLVAKEIKNMINTEHGIERESNAIETFEKLEGVKLNTAQEFFKCHICTIDNTEYYLGGKLDGIHPDYIVEIKNRTKQFFYKVRNYEMIQIQLYMHILNYKKAKLVERLNQKMRINEVDRDDNLIEETLTKLKIFCKLFDDFLKNNQKKTEYYKSSFSDKENFIYINFYLKIESEYQNLMEVDDDVDDDDDDVSCCISY